ncbi:ExbD/TolR family protein [Cytophaga aurantiaca]|uniref:ExbD/TolR family protein n=1 Tax=Cytophaga aurantiaca TaxID=29530 RepID=UPI00037F3964|nr:biopolymer transporter ExbD [Cytophaga aurantiaca]
MAEINTGGGDKGGKKRSKKMSTKVDMTPMVDLAFLLITFFMLATTLTKQQKFDFAVPPDVKDQKDQPELKASNAITLILGKDDAVYWYVMNQDGTTDFHKTDFSEDGIRATLIERKKAVGKNLNVVIKPMKDSKYKNLVDIIDELGILGIGKQALVDATPNDIQLVQAENASVN